MKDYIKKNGIKLAALVLAAAVFMLVSSRVISGTAGFMTNMVGMVRVPLQTAATALSDWVGDVYGYLYEYDNLVAENEALRIELAEAEARARAGDDALEENERLRELLGYLDPSANYVTESARIVSWSSSNWTTAMTISKGSDHGLELGDGVMTEYGAFVGQVTELGDTWATVSTVTDVDTSVGALVGEDGAVAMVVGNFALMQEGQVMLNYLAEGAQMFLDDVIMTSGMGGNIPQGLMIGTISSVQTEAGGQVEYGIIEPTCDFDSLVQVFVIKDFEVVE